MKKAVIMIIILFLLSVCYAVPDEEQMITLSKETSFNDALHELEVLATKYENKKIVNLSGFNDTIGTPIVKGYWRDALRIITSFNGLVLEELPGSFTIKDPKTEKELEKIGYETKQVKISAIFFKGDKTILNSLGLDWSTLINGKVQGNIDFQGASPLADEVVRISGNTAFSAGNVSIDLNALLKVLEANQVGTVMARPNLVVLSGKKGYIQVGEDFSVKTTDEAGNITDKFFSTGVILDVTPKIVTEDGKEAVHLSVKVEKSSAIPGELSTVINKSQSNTDVILYDGEETVIGGLYDTDKKSQRNGIPFLKDLPWWVLGIKYLTGYEKIEQTTREMIIILRAEIVRPIPERMMQAKKAYHEEIDDFLNGNREFEQIMKPLDASGD